jgi:hypothetical protein
VKDTIFIGDSKTDIITVLFISRLL